MGADYPLKGWVSANIKDKDKNFLFRPQLGARSESAQIPILTSATRIFKPAGDVKDGRKRQEEVRICESGRLRQPRGDLHFAAQFIYHGTYSACSRMTDGPRMIRRRVYSDKLPPKI